MLKDDDLGASESVLRSVLSFSVASGPEGPGNYWEECSAILETHPVRTVSTFGDPARETYTPGSAQGGRFKVCPSFQGRPLPTRYESGPAQGYATSTRLTGIWPGANSTARRSSIFCYSSNTAAPSKAMRTSSPPQGIITGQARKGPRSLVSDPMGH